MTTAEGPFENRSNGGANDVHTVSGMPGETNKASGDRNGFQSGVDFSSLGDLVTARLRHEIETGLIPPGMWLRQDELARRLKVSRNPVRSAILELASQGLVELIPRRGARVSTPSVALVREVFELRAAVEALALERAAELWHPGGDAGRLIAAAAELDEVGSGDAFYSAREEFYSLLYRSDRFKVTGTLIATLRSRLVHQHLTTHYSETHFSHVELAQLVLTGNVNAAKSALTEHLGAIRNALVSQVESDHESGEL